MQLFIQTWVFHDDDAQCLLVFLQGISARGLHIASLKIGEKGPVFRYLILSDGCNL
jgi:hypothetical protein